MTHRSTPHLRRLALTVTCVLLILCGLSSAMNTTYAQVRAYVANSSDNTVSTIPMGAFALPHGVAVTPDGLRFYVVNQGFGSVSVIDTTTNAVITSVPVGSNPLGIAIMPSTAPTTKDECKNGGYKKFLTSPGPFKNQGQCVKSVANAH